jgi:hypothetical protein
MQVHSTPSLTLDTATPLDAFPGLIAACHAATAGTVARDTIAQVSAA